MRSQLAEAARRRLADDVKRMTPEQRLAAFLAHRQLMADVAEFSFEAKRSLRGHRHHWRTGSAVWMHGGRVRGASAVPPRHEPIQPGQRTGCRKDMSIESADA
jgi:hypothetical protein